VLIQQSQLQPFGLAVVEWILRIKPTRTWVNIRIFNQLFGGSASALSHIIVCYQIDCFKGCTKFLTKSIIFFYSHRLCIRRIMVLLACIDKQYSGAWISVIKPNVCSIIKGLFHNHLNVRNST
jgi:hypothetical protein